MIYHSEYIIRTIVLWVNRKNKITRLGNTFEEIEKGVLLNAPNLDRKTYFTYASFIISLFTLGFIPITVTAMIVYLSTCGLNFGLMFCMLMLIPVFISNKLSKKAKQCNQEKFLIEFTTKDLIWSLFKYFTITSVMIATMMWLASTH